jgi:small subunit ribosomal protein S16
MAVKIRLARGGAKKVPYYRIVVANATAPRDGDFLEKVGTYNPLLADKEGNRVVLVKERIAYWLSKGANPTDRVAKFLAEAGIALPEHIKKKMAVKLKSRTTKLSKKAAKEEAEAKVAAAKAGPAPVAAAVVEAPVEVAPEAVVEAAVVEAPVEVAPEAVVEAAVVEAPVEVAPEAVVEAEAPQSDEEPAPAADEESK